MGEFLELVPGAIGNADGDTLDQIVRLTAYIACDERLSGADTVDQLSAMLVRFGLIREVEES